MAKRTITTLLGATIALLLAAPAHATLVYNKTAKNGLPKVFVADNDGSNPRLVGRGFEPVVSPDGRWIAWIAGDGPEVAKMQLADGSRKARDVAKAGQIDTLQFSPDSKLLGIGASTRVWAYNIHDRESVKAASGNIRGFSFSPDSKSIAFGTAGHNQSFDSPTDLYSFVDRRQAADPDHARPQVAEPAVDRPRDHPRPPAHPRQRGAVLQPVRDQAGRRQPAPDHRAHDPAALQRPDPARAVRER